MCEADTNDDKLLAYSEHLMGVFNAKMWRARALKFMESQGSAEMDLPLFSMWNDAGQLQSPVVFNQALRNYIIANWEEISCDVISDMETDAEAVRKHI